MQITRGIVPCAQKVIVYGPEGIGKSTFASRFPEPLFIDTEGGTRSLDVTRLPEPTSWAMILDEIGYVKRNPDICKTLVIDTADWAERMCITAVCARADKTGLEDFGYGKGYTYLGEEFGKLLNALNEIIAKNINVLINAHAKMRKFEQPDETGSYDRWELKLTKFCAPMLMEWGDMVLFANYKTEVIKGKNEMEKNKVVGGKRVMYTAHHPCWDAKNRQGLKEVLAFDYTEIAHCIPGAGASVVKPEPEVIPIPAPTPEPPAVSAGLPKALTDLMEANGVTEEEIHHAVADVRGYFPRAMRVADYPQKFLTENLVGAWDMVYGVILEEREKGEIYDGKPLPF